MTHKIRDTLFFLICFTLMFNNIPKYLRIPFIGGPLGDKLVFYPLVAGMIYTIYCQWKKKDILVNKKWAALFVGVYVGFTLLSTVLGVINYPYYELVMQGPQDQIEKLPRVLNFLQAHGINVSFKALLSFWMVARPVKNVLMDAFYNFGTAYMLYCWYRSDWQRGLKVLIGGMTASLLIACGFSVIETIYLAGSTWAREVLVHITPFFLSINERNSAYGWPALLLELPQLRSVFAEPSFFGLYAAFALPFLWYVLLGEVKRKPFFIVLTTSFTFFTFLTKARTSVALLLGELLLLGLCILFYHRKNTLKGGAWVLTCTMLAFLCSVYFVENIMIKETHVFVRPRADMSTQVNVAKAKSSSLSLKQLTNYLDDNVVSIASADRRSNVPRYAYIKAACRVGAEHPVFGVGKGLTAGYMMHKFTAAELEDHEVQQRLLRIKQLGVLGAPIPIVCEYAAKFAEFGIVGLVLSLVPIAYAIYRALRKLKLAGEEQGIIALLIALMGILAGGMSTVFSANHCLWIVLGLLYAATETNKNKSEVLEL